MTVTHTAVWNTESCVEHSDLNYAPHASHLDPAGMQRIAHVCTRKHIEEEGFDA